MNTSDEKLGKRAKALFDESVDGLDAETLSRLNRGRQAAIEAAADGRRSQWVRWAPATGVAAAAVFAVMVMQRPGNDVIEAPASDFEILLSEESIDMLEDLEFYAWLDASDLDLNGDG